MIALFAAAVATPSVLGMLGICVSPEERIELEERRPRAAWPGWPTNRSALERFSGRVEAWYNDRFGLRPWMVRANAFAHLGLGVSPDRSLVILGEDGWLFLGNRLARVLDQHRGLFPFDDEELDRAVGVLAQRRAWLEARGIPMVFVLAPDKHEIYPERLPPWARRTLGPTRREQFLRALADGNVPHVDLAPAVREASTKHLAYFLTDSHWNEYGAFAGYAALMDFLRLRLGREGLRDVSRTPHEVVREARAGLALPEMLGMDGRDFDDQTVRVRFDRPLGSVEVYTPDDVLVSRGGNRRIGKRFVRRVRRVDGAGGGLRVLILRDSFTTNMSPFLNLSFREVIYCDFSEMVGREMVTLVDRYDPDLVLFIKVQRMLGRPFARHPAWLRPDGLTPSDRFARAEPVCRGGAGDLASRVIRRRDVSSVENMQGRLAVRTARQGASMTFAPLSPSRRGTHLLRLRVKSARTGSMKLAFRPVRSRRSQRAASYRVAPLLPGWNRVYFELPSGGAGGAVRLWFLAGPGEYVLEGYEVRRRVNRRR